MLFSSPVNTNVRGEDCLKVKKDYYNQYQVMTKDPLVQAGKKKPPLLCTQSVALHHYL
jgi:hypothetical protein